MPLCGIENSSLLSVSTDGLSSRPLKIYRGVVDTIFFVLYTMALELRDCFKYAGFLMNFYKAVLGLPLPMPYLNMAASSEMTLSLIGLSAKNVLN